jgi:hypothetical protein
MTSVLQAALAGQALVRKFDHWDALTAHALRLLEVTRDEPGAGFLAASAPGERFVGAALALSRGSASGWREGAHTTAIVCDVVMASGSSCYEAAARARTAGATRVIAVVVADLFDSQRAGLPGVDRIIVLEPTTASDGRSDPTAAGLHFPELRAVVSA